MPRVVHFDIQADDPERAIAFYEAVLGWKFQKWDGPMEYWLVETGPEDAAGINGGLARRPQGVAAPGGAETRAPGAFECTVDVPSADDAAVAVEKNGGTVLNPKAPIPGVGWLVQCRDTEGNSFSMMQEDPEAK